MINLNIIVTVNTFYPKLDGVQAVTEYLCLGLLNQGHNITVITPTVEGFPNEETYKNIKIFRVNVYTKYAIYHGNKKDYREFIIELSKKNDVIVNVCTQNALTDYLLPVLDKIDCKKVLHIHGIYDFNWKKDDFCSIKSMIYKAWRNIKWGILYNTNKSNFKKYDAVMQLHKFDLGNIYFEKKYNIDSFILENSCDKNFAELDSIEKEKTCICVANYNERKNQEFILKAFYGASIPEDWKLVFIGSEKTSYYDKLVELDKSYSEKYGKKSVEFLYGVSRRDTIEKVKKSSIYLMGSKWEAFSISIIESMAAKVPFISTNVGITRFLPGGVVVDDIKSMSYWIELFVYNDIVRLDYGNIGHDYYINRLAIDKKIDELNELLINLG